MIHKVTEGKFRCSVSMNVHIAEAGICSGLGYEVARLKFQINTESKRECNTAPSDTSFETCCDS